MPQDNLEAVTSDQPAADSSAASANGPFYETLCSTYGPESMCDEQDTLAADQAVDDGNDEGAETNPDDGSHDPVDPNDPQGYNLDETHGVRSWLYRRWVDQFGTPADRAMVQHWRQRQRDNDAQQVAEARTFQRAHDEMRSVAWTQLRRAAEQSARERGAGEPLQELQRVANEQLPGLRQRDRNDQQRNAGLAELASIDMGYAIANPYARHSRQCLENLGRYLDTRLSVHGEVEQCVVAELSSFTRNRADRNEQFEVRSVAQTVATTRGADGRMQDVPTWTISYRVQGETAARTLVVSRGTPRA